MRRHCKITNKRREEKEGEEGEGGRGRGRGRATQNGEKRNLNMYVKVDEKIVCFFRSAIYMPFFCDPSEWTLNSFVCYNIAD